MPDPMNPTPGPHRPRPDRTTQHHGLIMLGPDDSQSTSRLDGSIEAQLDADDRAS